MNAPHLEFRIIVLSDSSPSLDALVDFLKQRDVDISDWFFSLSVSDVEGEIMSEEPQLLFVDVNVAQDGALFEFVERMRSKNQKLVSVCVTGIPNVKGPFERVLLKYAEKPISTSVMEAVREFFDGKLERLGR